MQTISRGASRFWYGVSEVSGDEVVIVSAAQTARGRDRDRSTFDRGTDGEVEVSEVKVEEADRTLATLTSRLNRRRQENEGF